MGVLIDLGGCGVVVAGTVDSVLDGLADELFHRDGAAEFRFEGDTETPVWVNLAAVRRVRDATPAEGETFWEMRRDG